MGRRACILPLSVQGESVHVAHNFNTFSISVFFVLPFVLLSRPRWGQLSTPYISFINEAVGCEHSAERIIPYACCQIYWIGYVGKSISHPLYQQPTLLSVLQSSCFFVKHRLPKPTEVDGTDQRKQSITAGRTNHLERKTSNAMHISSLLLVEMSGMAYRGEPSQKR